jgi:large subunit ribosomal protein L9
MPANIQVLLQRDVDKLGQSGQLVRVRPGFARNYLLPRQLAVPATAGAVRRIEHERAVAVSRADKGKKEAIDVAAKLNALTITIAQKAGEDGRLFGSVTSKDIESAVKALLKDSLPKEGSKEFLGDLRKHIKLPELLKTLGSHEIVVKLLPDVTATLKVEVVASTGKTAK